MTSADIEKKNTCEFCKFYKLKDNIWGECNSDNVGDQIHSYYPIETKKYFGCIHFEIISILDEEKG